MLLLFSEQFIDDVSLIDQRRQKTAFHISSMNNLQFSEMFEKYLVLNLTVSYSLLNPGRENPRTLWSFTEIAITSLPSTNLQMKNAE